MRSRWTAWWILAGILFVGSPAQGQSSRQRAQAGVLAGEALDLFDAGDYETALQRFAAADKLYPTTTLKLQAARCLDKLDRLLESIQKYREVIAVELMTRRNPRSHFEARAAAKGELKALRKTLPALLINVQGVGGHAATVTIDGEPMGAEFLGKPVERNPGHYTIEARSGQREARKVVRLRRGETERIALKLRLPPNLRPTKEPWSPTLWTAGWIVGGLGLSGLVVGSVTGAKVVADEEELLARCPDRQCLPEAHADARSFETVRTISTVALSVGAVTFATGVVLLVLGRKRSDKKPDAVGSVEPFWAPPARSFSGPSRAGQPGSGHCGQPGAGALHLAGVWGLRGRF